MRIDDQTTVADFLVLGTWEVITLLGEARERCDAANVSELLTKAEEILISVVSELPALTRSVGSSNRGNGFAMLGEAFARGESTQTPFDYRPRDRGSRNS